MHVTRDGDAFTLKGKTYELAFDPARPLHIDLTFANGLGGELFVASGCDRDERIDTLVSLDKPTVIERGDGATVSFKGRTTLWEAVEYRFVCEPTRVLYSYTVQGKGALDNARFFEGFLEDDPRMEDRYYPYFAGPGRHLAHHRPWKWFAASTTPKFEKVHCFSINSTDTREVMYYQSIEVRVCGTRVNLGGDWLITPPPFLYQLRSSDGAKGLVNVGLLLPIDDRDVEEFQYLGGEGVGFNLTYDGYRRVDGSWTSPKLLLEQIDGDEYTGLDGYCEYLRAEGYVKPNAHRQDAPRWWFEPIFGGWGEQVFRSDHWTNYFGARSSGYSGSSDMECSQPRYEWMLKTLESREIYPTILIVDNRWFRPGNQLEVDTQLWPDMKQFVADQHQAGRKVILWVSPWEYCPARRGDDVPYNELLIAPRDTSRYHLAIDTDVFYPACKREKKKVHADLQWNQRGWPWQTYPNPYHKGYQRRIADKVRHLLSKDGLDADGFEFDYTHYWEAHRGIVPIDPAGCDDDGRPHTGLEILHKLLGLYYHAAKAAKKDALVITHTFSPHFDDVIDMLRLQDIYTDRADITPQMAHRVKLANAVAPGAPVHTDQHPMPSLHAWRKYAEAQPALGNPCLYYVTGIETTHEEFEESDFELLRRTWSAYHRQLDERFGAGTSGVRQPRAAK